MRFAFAFPFDVGIEGAGTVLAVGPGVTIQPGARVCWTAVVGSCATHVIAPVQMLAEIPEGLRSEAGASLAHAGITAAGLVRHCPLVEGQRAVVWGAAGAVGRILVAFLAARGVSVIGIASGTRTNAVRDAGAAHVVDRLTDDVVERVKAHTGARGAAAVFEPIGAATFETNLRLLAPRGYLVNYGQLSGALPVVNLSTLMEAGSVFVTKYGPRAGVLRLEDLSACLSEALCLAVARPLVSDIAARFPLDRVTDAYRALDVGVPGKVLVVPDSAGRRSRRSRVSPPYAFVLRGDGRTEYGRDRVRHPERPPESGAARVRVAPDAAERQRPRKNAGGDTCERPSDSSASPDV